MSNIMKNDLEAPTIKAETGIAVGGATPGTGGIAFPATAVAVADANTLDDYEEGTFTPTFWDAIEGGNEASYSLQEGHYVKIGRLVHFRFSLGIAGVAGMTGGNAGYVRGLPFVGQTVSGNTYTPIAAILTAATFSGYVHFSVQSAKAAGLFRSSVSTGGGASITVTNFGIGYALVNGSYQI